MITFEVEGAESMRKYEKSMRKYEKAESMEMVRCHGKENM